MVKLGSVSPPIRPNRILLLSPGMPFTPDTLPTPPFSSSQLDLIFELYKQRRDTIGLFFKAERSGLAAEVKLEMEGKLLSTPCVVQQFEMSSSGSGWLTSATKSSVSHCVFLNYPPTDKLEQVSRFFDTLATNECRVNKVVFVENSMATPSLDTPSVEMVGLNQFQRFLHLDGRSISVLADCILAHFAG